MSDLTDQPHPPRTVRNVVVSLVVGLVAGAAAYARAGPDAAAIPAEVQTVLLTLLGASLAVAGVILGNSISADATRASAQMAQADAQAARKDSALARAQDRADADNARAQERMDADMAREDARLEAQKRRELDRDDARAARFADLKVSLTVDLLREADVHKRQAEANVTARAERWYMYWVEQEPERADKIEVPSIGPTEPVRWALQALDLIAPRVAPVADDLYTATVNVGQMATRYVDQDDPAGDKWWKEWKALTEDWLAVRARFVDAVRADFGVNTTTG